MTSDGDKKFLTAEEIEKRIHALSKADCVRLVKIGGIYAEGTDWAPHDLLQEALIAALERRQWRSDLSTTVFLVGVMRSLAHSRHKSQKVAVLDCALAGGEEDGETLEQLATGDEEDPANVAAEDEALGLLLGRLSECFSGDEEVQLVIAGRMAGDSPADIRAALGMNQTQYETVCRRLLRGYEVRMKEKQL